MRIPLKYTLLLISLLLSVSALAQTIDYVRINEIQVYNTNGFKDEYGQSVGWIELFNTGFGRVNVAGCVLEVKGIKYQIPRGNPATLMSTRGYMIFYASGAPDQGPFHTNFTLENTDFIKFYDIDGKLIDSLYFNPAEMVDGVSYGWLEDIDGVEKLMHLPATTPGSNNNTIEKESRAESFRKADPSGIILTLINIIIVAIALTLLFFVFKYMGNYHTKAATRSKREKKKKVKKIEHIEPVAKDMDVISNDELAAIAIALYHYSKELHDNEELVLTMNKVSRAYSPWSSKIYGLRQLPNKK